MLKKWQLITVDVFFYNYPEGSYADAGNDDYYKTGYQALTQNHVLGFLFGNLKTVILGTTVREQ